jgi:hypothetical protein
MALASSVPRTPTSAATAFSRQACAALLNNALRERGTPPSSSRVREAGRVALPSRPRKACSSRTMSAIWSAAARPRSRTNWTARPPLGAESQADSPQRYRRGGQARRRRKSPPTTRRAHPSARFPRIHGVRRPRRKGPERARIWKADRPPSTGRKGGSALPASVVQVRRSLTRRRRVARRHAGAAALRSPPPTETPGPRCEPAPRERVA